MPLWKRLVPTYVRCAGQKHLLSEDACAFQGIDARTPTFGKLAAGDKVSSDVLRSRPAFSLERLA